MTSKLTRDEAKNIAVSLFTKGQMTKDVLKHLKSSGFRNTHGKVIKANALYNLIDVPIKTLRNGGNGAVLADPITEPIASDFDHVRPFNSVEQTGAVITPWTAETKIQLIERVMTEKMAPKNAIGWIEFALKQ